MSRSKADLTSGMSHTRSKQPGNTYAAFSCGPPSLDPSPVARGENNNWSGATNTLQRYKSSNVLSTWRGGKSTCQNATRPEDWLQPCRLTNHPFHISAQRLVISRLIKNTYQSVTDVKIPQEQVKDERGRHTGVGRRRGGDTKR